MAKSLFRIRKEDYVGKLTVMLEIASYLKESVRRFSSKEYNNLFFQLLKFQNGFRMSISKIQSCRRSVEIDAILLDLLETQKGRLDELVENLGSSYFKNHYEKAYSKLYEMFDIIELELEMIDIRVK